MYKVLFNIGGFPVYSYGLMLIIAFFVGVAIARMRASQYGLKPDQIWDVSFWVLIAGVLGARIVFILQELPYYLEHKDKLFALRFDGLTSYGGLLGGLIAFIVWSLVTKVPLLKILDCIAPSVFIGHAIGRIGCLLNGCCYGGQCDLPWGIHVHDDHGMLLPGLYHPAQIYDSIFNIVGFVLALLIARRGLKSGQMMSLFLIFHGLARVIYEVWRTNTTSEAVLTLIVPITEAQIASALIMFTGIVLFIVFAKKGAKA
jgi:phosphatidylglycerol:prolipoprotein diacylglycerol transferase